MKKRVLMLLLAQLAVPALATELPGYDFEYRISGDAAIEPVQVFDDGKQLYVELRSQAAIPAFFVRTPTGYARLPVRQEFPYLVADRLAPVIQVRLEGMQATITYTGGRALTGAGRVTGAARVQSETTPARVVTAEAGASVVPEFAGGSFSGELIFHQSQPNPSASANPVVQSAVYASSAPQSLKVRLRSDRNVRLMRLPVHRVAEVADVHVVQPGESLSCIAVHYGISVDKLARWNGIADVNRIRTGQRIRLVGPVGVEKLGVVFHMRAPEDAVHDAATANRVDPVHTVIKHGLTWEERLAVPPDSSAAAVAAHPLTVWRESHVGVRQKRYRAASNPAGMTPPGVGPGSHGCRAEFRVRVDPITRYEASPVCRDVDEPDVRSVMYASDDRTKIDKVDAADTDGGAQ